MLAGNRTDGAETFRPPKPDQREDTEGRLGEEGMEWGEQGINVSELVALLRRRWDAEKELARVFRENPVAKHDGTERPLTAEDDVEESLKFKVIRSEALLALKGKWVLIIPISSSVIAISFAASSVGAGGDMRGLLADDIFELSVDVVMVMVVEAVKMSSADETGDSSSDSELLSFAMPPCPSGRVSQEAIGASFGLGRASWKVIG